MRWTVKVPVTLVVYCRSLKTGSKSALELLPPHSEKSSGYFLSRRPRRKRADGMCSVGSISVSIQKVMANTRRRQCAFSMQKDEFIFERATERQHEFSCHRFVRPL